MTSWPRRFGLALMAGCLSLPAGQMVVEKAVGQELGETRQQEQILRRNLSGPAALIQRAADGEIRQQAMDS